MEPRVSFVTLGVHDVARSRLFYETLGFKASSASNDDVTFFDGGGVVLAVWSRDALAKDAGISGEGSGFSRIALAHNVRTEAEVAVTLVEAAAAGGRVIRKSEKVFWGGQTGYFADPDGHLWEVAYNPMMPLDEHGHVTLPFETT